MSRLLAILGTIGVAIAAFLGLKLRGDHFKGKAETLKSENANLKGAIDDVEKAKDARASLSDPAVSARLRDKYRRPE